MHPGVDVGAGATPEQGVTREGAIMKGRSGRGTWAMGGGLLLGLGVGLYFLEHASLSLVGALITGLGAGLLLTVLMSGGK